MKSYKRLQQCYSIINDFDGYQKPNQNFRGIWAQQIRFIKYRMKALYLMLRSAETCPYLTKHHYHAQMYLLGLFTLTSSEHQYLPVYG